jgi:hypothetical protein
MRGDIESQRDLVVTVTPEELVPRDHPIRMIKKMADEALKKLGRNSKGFTRREGGRRFRPKCS